MLAEYSSFFNSGLILQAAKRAAEAEEYVVNRRSMKPSRADKRAARRQTATSQVGHPYSRAARRTSCRDLLAQFPDVPTTNNRPVLRVDTSITPEPSQKSSPLLPSDPTKPHFFYSLTARIVANTPTVARFSFGRRPRAVLKRSMSESCTAGPRKSRRNPRVFAVDQASRRRVGRV